MYKKIIILIFALILSAGVVLTGCNEEDGDYAPYDPENGGFESMVSGKDPSKGDGNDEGDKETFIYNGGMFGPGVGTDSGEDVSTDNEANAETESAMTYEEYNSLSAEEQYAYFSKFSSMEEFFLWYNAAKDEYEANKDNVDIESGSIDIGDIFGGN